VETFARDLRSTIICRSPRRRPGNRPARHPSERLFKMVLESPLSKPANNERWRETLAISYCAMHRLKTLSAPRSTSEAITVRTQAFAPAPEVRAIPTVSDRPSSQTPCSIRRSARRQHSLFGNHAFNAKQPRPLIKALQRTRWSFGLLSEQGRDSCGGHCPRLDPWSLGANSSLRMRL